jgi:dipicolinate synthase subunit A
MNKVISVIGGDDRQAALIDIINKNGFEVRAYGFDKLLTIPPEVESYDQLAPDLFDVELIFMPIPCSTDGVHLNAKYSGEDIYVTDILKHIKPGTLIIMGKADIDMINSAMHGGFHISDIMTREDFAVLNSIPSAEGALQIAMENTGITIWNSRCMVLGFGRLGKVLTKLLTAMGAKVTATARKPEDLAWISAYGAVPIHTFKIDNVLHEQDIIFNTIPSVTLKDEQLAKVKKSCLIVDLASYPGGVDFTAAKEYGVKTMFCPGLPGKVAPLTSAQFIWDTAMSICKENGIEGAKCDELDGQEDRHGHNGFVLHI